MTCLYRQMKAHPFAGLHSDAAILQNARRMNDIRAAAVKPRYRLAQRRPPRLHALARSGRRKQSQRRCRSAESGTWYAALTPYPGKDDGVHGPAHRPPPLNARNGHKHGNPCANATTLAPPEARLMSRPPHANAAATPGNARRSMISVQRL